MNATRSLEKRDLQPKVSEAWARVIARIGKGHFADAIGCCSATVDNALTGPGLPEAHTLLNSLLADPTALDEVLRLYGMRVVPLKSKADEDIQVIADMAGVQSDWLERLLDGRRCHRDTAALAKRFRPLIAKMQAVIEEADKV